MYYYNRMVGICMSDPRNTMRHASSQPPPLAVSATKHHIAVPPGATTATTAELQLGTQRLRIMPHHNEVGSHLSDWELLF